MRLFVSTVLLATAATLVPALELDAQTPAPAQSIGVAPGTRVRVRAPNLVAPLIANFLNLTADTAVFIEDAAGRGIWSIRVNEISRLERSDGEKRMNAPYMLRGGLMGAGIGAATGLLFAATFKPSDDKKKYDRLTTGLVGAGAGAVVGVLLGGRVVKEKWVEVPLRRFSVAPTKRGVSVGAGFDF